MQFVDKKDNSGMQEPFSYQQATGLCWIVRSISSRERALLLLGTCLKVYGNICFKIKNIIIILASKPNKAR